MKKSLIFALTLAIATPHAHAIDMKKISVELLKSCWHVAEIGGGAIFLMSIVAHYQDVKNGDKAKAKIPHLIPMLAGVAGSSSVWHGAQGLYQQVIDPTKKESDVNVEELEDEASQQEDSLAENSSNSL